MNEPLLRSILRLYALFAGSDGLLEGEKKRISRFLSTHLSPDSVAHFIQLLEKWCLEYAPNFGNKDWLGEELREISQTVNKELLLSQRYYLFLELIELSLTDNQISLAEDEILNLLPSLLNLPEGDVAILREFAIGNGVFSAPGKDVLIVSDNKPVEISEDNFWAFPGFSGNLAILKLGGTDTYFVQYNGKKETTLNGQVMESGISRIWAPGASLRQQGIGPLFFSYIQERISDPGEKPKINFQASNLSLRFPDGRIGLNDISLSEKGGRMVAIMGGSGCGKSTLLNVLNGNEKPNQGKILINGLDVHRDAVELEGVIGYIPQDDLLNERLTVFENMYFAAKFSFGNLPEHEIVAMADRMLDSLGLAATRDKEVGSPAKKTISGGQRKRLNIGLELVRQPWVLFVDEPTSGLSSSDSLRTMELLKNLSLTGKLVFVIIHQPSAEIFRMFDRLMVMDTGGNPVFYGNPLEAVPYFRKEAMLPELPENAEAADAAEIFNILETKLVKEDGHLSDQRKFQPQDWEMRFRKNFSLPEVETETSPVPHLTIKPGFFKQIGLYFRRDVLAKIHDKQYLLINILEAPALALLLALVVRYAPIDNFLEKAYKFSTNENIPAYFFMSVIVALFMGMSVSAEEIIRDRLLLKRERFLHLNRDSYLIAKVLLLFLLSLVHTLAFVLISDLVLKVPKTGMEFWMVLFATSCWANLLGLVLSDTFRNAVVVYILIPLLLIPQIVLGGALVRYDRLNPFVECPGKVPLVGEAMVARWAYEALMVAQFKNNPFQSQIFEIELKREEAHYRRSAYLPELERLSEAAFRGEGSSEENVQRRKLLFNELSKESARFGLSAQSFNFLLKNDRISETAHAAIQKRIQDFVSHYNKSYSQLQADLDRVYRQTGFDSSGKSVLAGLKERYENEQVARFLSEDFAMQPRLEVSPDGIFRKEKPGYQKPEPDHFLDFRTHLYAPFKHFAGRLFPTEMFNIVVIWALSLVTFLVLRFRLLRVIFRIRD